ncbi:hypothetical protein GUJ93_ZPchr0013g36377 [Zizania palustris]|uniref:Uncharacterized protein n=1 Tax=Zizania palustris TaxID=103762 RepID=A0A8J5X5H6_ZIZPA|nr:hypothetical protein GUJ93_ZPchr0013g36377 [Zizania palustris]
MFGRVLAGEILLSGVFLTNGTKNSSVRMRTIDDGEDIEDDDAAGLLGGEQDPAPHRPPPVRPFLHHHLLLLLHHLVSLPAGARTGILERRAPRRREKPHPARGPGRTGQRREHLQHAAGRPQRGCRHPRLQRRQRHPPRGRHRGSHATCSDCLCFDERPGALVGRWWWRRPPVFGRSKDKRFISRRRRRRKPPTNQSTNHLGVWNSWVRKNGRITARESGEAAAPQRRLFSVERARGGVGWRRWTGAGGNDEISQFFSRSRACFLAEKPASSACERRRTVERSVYLFTTRIISSSPCVRTADTWRHWFS